MLKTLARTTPLVKAVLLTKVTAVYVLLDLRAGVAIKVKSTSYIFIKSSFTMQEKMHYTEVSFSFARTFVGMGYRECAQLQHQSIQIYISYFPELIVCS